MGVVLARVPNRHTPDHAGGLGPDRPDRRVQGRMARLGYR